ncbi:hypothetical protein H0H10_35960 [Streptomyces sp. TRM S81-3]|uniref:Uncharacterized protein n=1 Tax=Streptomyces griseicoloratus TaxID=2752516 RepID=A0A926LAF2_9ACTN|nr:hypothetical protein [Streptomyces griseicoloratus]MBD0424501.1 hypothetical protein [Streptomyces griseicoloratus]
MGHPLGAAPAASAAGNAARSQSVKTVRARAVSERLPRRGRLARTGDSFALRGAAAAGQLRLTVHQLDGDQAVKPADDLVEAVGAASAGAPSRVRWSRVR